MTQITPIAADALEVTRLVAALDAYQIGLYGEEHCHLEPIAALCSPHVVMLAATEASQVLAIGAVKLMTGYGELKRVIVDDRYRGRGIGKLIIHSLERVVAESGRSTVLCETGVAQDAALQLYRSLGYERTGAFGSYRENHVSVFLRKKLNTPSRVNAR